MNRDMETIRRTVKQQSPNRRRWRRFRKNRRGYWSLMIFSIFFITSLFAEVLSNDKPFLIIYLV